MTATYATVKELAQFMNIEGVIPGRKGVGSDRIKETIGTGDASTTRFFTDNAFVISDTYSLVYGATEAAATSALTETTHYTMNKDDGIVTLTGAGVTLISTNIIYGAYSYCNIGITDTQLQAALDRAEVYIDEMTNNHWATGTDATPNYNQVTDEKHDGKGKYDRDYYTDKYPLPNVSTLVNGAITADDGTIIVDSTTGFPSSGYLTIETDKIAYTGKTTTTFTGCTSVSAHDDNSTVYGHVIEISGTGSGTSPTWTILKINEDYDIDYKTGRIHVMRDDLILNSIYTTYPPLRVPNRLRFNYQWGNETIPADIKQLCLMIATRDILHMAVRMAHGAGRNDFSPDLVNVDEDWIKETIKNYTNHMSSNV